MLNWLRRLLGVRALCTTHRGLADLGSLGGPLECPACVGYERGYREATRIEGQYRPPLHEHIEAQQRKTRTSERYDEINRRKKRQRKARHSV